jgi:chromosomal replication initiation ATPase DnaA
MEGNNSLPQTDYFAISDIIDCAASAAEISKEEMLMPDKTKGARKREYVVARQISMSLCKELTKQSLATIGARHGGRDHATVLHAIKTVNDMIDTKDFIVINWLTRARELIKERHIETSPEHQNAELMEMIKEHINGRY